MQITFVEDRDFGFEHTPLSVLIFRYLHNSINFIKRRLLLSDWLWLLVLHNNLGIGNGIGFGHFEIRLLR